MSEINCPVCGTLCKIVANPTFQAPFIHYEPIAHSTLLAECEGLKAKLAKMKEAVSEKIIKVLGFTKIGGKYLPDQWITEIAQAIAEEVEK